MAESEETKAAVEYWDRLPRVRSRAPMPETAERNRDRAVEKDARECAAEISLER